MIQKTFSSLVLKRFASCISILALLLTITPNLAIAAGITSAKDTATRLKISTEADHTITFTLPTGVDFDSTTNTDAIQVQFAATFTPSGTWTTADFSFNDGTPRTINVVAQGAGTIDTTVAAGANFVGVAVDTTNNIFTIKPSSTYTASATGAAVTFTILGTSPNGVLTNPAAVAATNNTIQMCDETAGCTTGTFTKSYTNQIAYGIADDDQVTISANVNSTITFDIDAKSDFSANPSAAPYLVHLGTLTTGSVKHSDTSSVEMIVLNGATNGSGGIAVTVQNANGASGLKSAGTPADTIPSATATMAAGTANYGICVDTATLTGFTTQGIYTASPCALASSTNHVATMTTSPVTIVSTSAPVSGAKAEVVVNAAIDGTTKAHTDYGDTITFIGTGTF